jgi:hypothetical protein
MLSVAFYVDFLVYALCAGCCYAECLYAECHGTTGEDDGSSKKLECLSLTNFFNQVPFSRVMQVKLIYELSSKCSVLSQSRKY